MSIDQGRHSLGVDFGTSNTVAVARWPDGRARPILVDGSPLLPSAVYAEAGGNVLAGRDAVHSARRDPGRFEPNPKRRIDDGLVLLGDEEFPVVDLIAAVLVRVADEWHRAVGPVRPELTLTCPATWGATRRGLLAEAAARAGLERARLVAEPVAAATYFAEVLGRDVPIGSVVVVHDFGAGTFDASVVARTAEGFEVLAVDGRDDLGGLDIDAALVEHIGTLCAERDPAVWQRLTEPATLEDRRAQRQLWDDVRIAKERLSRLQSADVVVPLLDLELHITRDELEELARPVLDQTVRVTRDLLRWAELPAGRLAGVFLVGGASRIPLVATLLHRELGEAPVAIEQPEMVVAEGSILADAALLATEPAAPGPTAEMRLLSRGQPPFPASSRAPAPALASAPASAAADASLPEGLAPISPSSSSASVSQPGFSAPPPRPASSPAASRPRPVPVEDQETVLSARNLLMPPGSPDLPPPAVDPWPDAQQHWTPDPDQTVAADPSWDLHSLPRPATSSARTASGPASGPPASGASDSHGPSSGSPASASASSGRAPSRGSGPVTSGRDEPGSAAFGRAQSGSLRSGGAQSASFATGRAQAGPATSGTAATRRSAVSSQPVSPSPGSTARSAGSRSVSPQGVSSRPVQPPASGKRPKGTGRRDAAPQPAARKRRRPGRLLRFIQLFLSVLVLVAVPLVAMVAAYSVIAGISMGAATDSLLDDLQRLLERV